MLVKIKQGLNPCAHLPISPSLRARLLPISSPSAEPIPPAATSQQPPLLLLLAREAGSRCRSLGDASPPLVVADPPPAPRAGFRRLSSRAGEAGARPRRRCSPAAALLARGGRGAVSSRRAVHVPPAPIPGRRPRRRDVRSPPLRRPRHHCSAPPLRPRRRRRRFLLRAILKVPAAPQLRKGGSLCPSPDLMASSNLPRLIIKDTGSSLNSLLAWDAQIREVLL
ncbi:hypothetical protein PVAP13_5NG573501 [Panicum virgatum]|uniref:Uncharacterized protein n=1 Tax=Panicum virgatum TaxID=38727 RepID=A0A8T0S3Z3_PANVG|nr:hypothetical protein PVAP13_5NG573501 [Panicum virgatum]